MLTNDSEETIADEVVMAMADAVSGESDIDDDQVGQDEEDVEDDGEDEDGAEENGDEDEEMEDDTDDVDEEEYDERLRKVARAIKEADPSGDFFVNGEHNVFPQPVISVEGVGDLVPPLTDSVMKELIAKCKLAPYGHGEKTLVDTHVRNTWELSVGQFQLPNSAWSHFVKDEILPSIRVPLGIDDSVKVEAKLSKMLVYEAGGKFEKHQDSEKEDGMFGKLVIVLPGHFEGGELVVHDPATAQDASSSEVGESNVQVWNPASMDPFAVKYAAFYGDCPHEVKPVTKGYRLCLTYNLVNVGQGETVPRFAGSHTSYAKLKDALCEFFTEEQASQSKSRRLDADGTKQACGFDVSKPETHRQCKFVYVLGHKYTKAGLSFKYLKNKDAQVAARLSRFCDESNGAFELYLCRVKYEFEWRGNEMTSYNSHKELGHEESLEKRLNLLSPWVARGGDKKSFLVAAKKSWKSLKGKLESEVAPVGKFERKSFKFDGKNEQLYTGNEGACLEKWYQSAALLVMPASVAMKAQVRGGSLVAFKRWVALAETNASQARALARGFYCAFLKSWSLTSEAGVQVVEAARQLQSLDVVRCVVTSVAELEFQPKLSETVAGFSAQDVATMSKAVCEAWEKRADYSVHDHLPSNRVNLVASLLNGVKDPERITLVLDAVAIKQRKDGSECEAEEYARVLLLASRVSLDRAKTLLCETDVTSFLGTVLPATVLMADSCEADDWDAVRPVVNYVIDWLTANTTAIKNAPYVAVVVKCGNCPYCDCNAVKKFLSSDADSQTLTARQAKRLKALELEDLIKMEPTTGKPGAMLAMKTCETKDINEQKQLEALREAIAKHTQ